MKDLKYQNIIYLTVLLFGFISCSKNVELSPKDFIPGEEAISTLKDLNDATIGSYAKIGYTTTLYANTLMADEARWSLDNNIRNYGLAHKWAFNAGETDVTAGWGNYYSVIDAVNKAIAAIPNIKAANENESNRITNMHGELLALRGFMHFELLRWFAEEFSPSSLGVVNQKVSHVLEKPLRNTFAESMTFIKEDFEEADRLMSATSTDKFRMTKSALSAIRARAALYDKDWKAAITFGNQALSTNNNLTSIANYSQLWKDASTNEVYFMLRRSSNSGSVRTLWTDDNQQVFFSPAFKLMNTYDQTNDVRYANFFSYDENLPATQERWTVIKYPGQDQTNRFNHLKVIRVSEIYLILAEAYAEDNQIAEGARFLNTLRKNRINGYADQTFANKDQLIDAVMLERYKELAFEGHRFFDLRRRNLPVHRIADDVASGAAIPLELKTTDINYVLPIPQSEMFANPTIQQNKGYGRQ